MFIDIILNKSYKDLDIKQKIEIDQYRFKLEKAINKIQEKEVANTIKEIRAFQRKIKKEE